MVNVKGKWALITGASRGIGYLSALFMAEQGCNLVLHSRSKAHCEKVLAEVKAKVGNIQMLKNGEIEPIRCECCDYCKSTKKLTKAIHFSEILLDYTD